MQEKFFFSILRYSSNCDDTVLYSYLVQPYEQFFLIPNGITYHSCAKSILISTMTGIFEKIVLQYLIIAVICVIDCLLITNNKKLFMVYKFFFIQLNSYLKVMRFVASIIKLHSLYYNRYYYRYS